MERPLTSGLVRSVALSLLWFAAGTCAAFMHIPSSIFPPPPTYEHGLLSASYPMLHRRSVELRASAKSFIGKAVTAVPSFIAQKTFDKIVSTTGRAMSPDGVSLVT